jgi:hypothetical protein
VPPILPSASLRIGAGRIILPLSPRITVSVIICHPIGIMAQIVYLGMNDVLRHIEGNGMTYRTVMSF